MSYNKIIIHAVIVTKHREPVLTANNKEALYRFIWKLLQDYNCKLFRIGGIEDHIHILFSIPPDKAIANIMRDLKRLASIWIKDNNIFPKFKGWSEGYCAISCCDSDITIITDYIKNQETHHKLVDSKTEFIKILQNANITYKPDYIE